MFRIVVLCFLLVVLQTKANHKTVDLQKAINLNLVKVKAEGLGGYQGFCIKMELKNQTKDSLVVLIEAGRRLNSIDDKYQNILIVREQLVMLKINEAKTVNVKGYCCQASNSSPSAGIKYDVNKMADIKLLLLARYLSTKNFDKENEQYAIWAVSDNHPTASISSSNDSLVLPLRQFVAAIKDEPLPWYTLVSSAYVYPSGNISITPLFLRGSMEYSNDKDNYITLTVFNEKGMPVCLTKTEWKKACTRENYKLNLPVKNLAKGKYIIELKTSEKQLAKKEFEI